MLLPVAYWSLAGILSLAVLAWLASLWRNDVSHVDSLWPLFFLVAALIYAQAPAALSSTALLTLLLVTVWSLRLALHIALRNHGAGEDARYRAIRANNNPGFRFKSLYIVFGLQGLLAWIISMPLLYAIAFPANFGPLQVAALLLWLIGFVFEAGGDWQLMRFRQREDSGDAVLDRGLWRYSRHPNYFGDACIWWSYWLLAAAAGGWWTVFSPLLMTLLLLKVSGVALLEKTIGERRPKYRDYVARTSAFLPWPPRKSGAESNVS